MTHQLQSSSVDVLNVAQSLTGDCNEWSALFVTLCRALGIPAQQVFGVVHTDQHMGYHAWARVLLNHQWHEIDPLWNQWQVDVSHLAWAAGDQSSQNVIAPLITQLQLKIQAYEAMGKSK